jgi:hypothetical protein
VEALEKQIGKKFDDRLDNEPMPTPLSAEDIGREKPKK